MTRDWYKDFNYDLEITQQKLSFLIATKKLIYLNIWLIGRESRSDGCSLFEEVQLPRNLTEKRERAVATKSCFSFDFSPFL